MCFPSRSRFIDKSLMQRLVTINATYLKVLFREKQFPKSEIIDTAELQKRPMERKNERPINWHDFV